jgi:quinol monooxygenase YgiN
MEQAAYTLALWRVTPGQEQAFRAAWVELEHAMLSLQRPPLFGVLLQDRSDPTLFYSFGPWNSIDDVDAMRRDPCAQDAFLRVTALCEEAQPGTYRLVEFVEPRQMARGL